MFCLKLAPALACGNTVVIKPSELTPLTALYLAGLCKEAGFPACVVNVVTGFGPTAGAAIAEHMDINKVAFTGSTAVGRKVQEASAKSNLKRVSLELGGKSPFIVLDADDTMLDEIVKKNADGIFNNQGQTCFSPSRAFIHDSIYDKFLKKMIIEAESRKVGDPLDQSTQMGSLISEVQMNRVLNYIKSGKDEGARCVTGGERLDSKGYFIKPTVFADVEDNMKIAQEEIFGPVLSVFKFSDVKEALKRANASNYGLAAGLFCNDINKVIPLADALDVGNVWINCYGILSNTGK
jgi:aldehyde dehydrogenase (NAD+)